MKRSILFLFLFLSLLLQNGAAASPAPFLIVPHYDARQLGYAPVPVPIAPVEQGGGGGLPYRPLDKSGPAQAPPETAVTLKLALANYEAVTHTYRLTDTLPVGLDYLPGSGRDLTYNPADRTLTWQGSLPGGNLDYIIQSGDISLPYLDLAAFGAPNLCEPFIAAGQDCQNTAVTINLGASGYSLDLYGQRPSQLTLSPGGLISPDPLPADQGSNRWLPQPEGPGFLVAGLWRAVNMGGVSSPPRGRWHAAVISGLLAGHDLFYVQWHDAPQAGDPNLTARHAVALVLGGPEVPLSGHLFYIYDNIANPAGTIARGYSIGIEDRPGGRGTTYAYAPCCGGSQPPQGYPPPAGTTLHLVPVLLGATNPYSRTFSYQAVTRGQPPRLIASTAVARSSSADPALAYLWDTHYLALRFLSFLPLELRA